MPWLALGVDAFLNVAGEVVIHDGIRASGPEIGDDFGDHPPAWLRRPEDGDRPVILFDHDFEAMLHFRERRVQVAGDFCFAHMDRWHTIDHTCCGKLHVHSAVHVEHMTGDVTGFFACQECYGGGDVSGRSHAL
jgi:hypothetical protein